MFRRGEIANLPCFTVDLRRQGRWWGWIIRSNAGNCLREGRERRRAEARYKAARALFQLLASSPYYEAGVQRCQDAEYD